MKTYKGYTIHKADPNPSGMRWYCRAEEADTHYPFSPSVVLKADTLLGIKRLITEHKTKKRALLNNR